MLLRPYQAAAQAAVYEHLRARTDNPCVVIPTAGGKTPVLAAICRDAVRWGGRVLILAHVKELLQQACEKLALTCPEARFGVHSAGLGRRDTDDQVIVAGIQSAHRRACDLGRFDLVIVDEAHLIPAEGDGMYRRFLADARAINPDLRLIGLTATPFRLKTGPICSPGGVLNAICFEVGVRELIRDGYLSPPVARAGRRTADTGGLRVRGGEFVAADAEALMDDAALVESACADIVEQAADRRACLIFAAGVTHGRHVVAELARRGVDCALVTGKTPARERDATLARFRAGELKFLTNVGVLTTGFDAPIIDCVALLRPTASAGLFYQMVGRGFRLHPGKRDFLVLDFGGNVVRHGPVDQLRPVAEDRGDGEAPAKECPRCRALVAAGFAACPGCGFAFPPRRRQRHEARAGEAGVLSRPVVDTRHVVRDVRYIVHAKRGAGDDHPLSMRVEYRVDGGATRCEWVCFEHAGYARRKAEAWWRRRSPDPVPDTARRAVDIANNGGVAATTAITVRTVAGERYATVLEAEIGDLPEPLPDWGDPVADDVVPF